MSLESRGVLRVGLLLLGMSALAVALSSVPGSSAALWPVEGSPAWHLSQVALVRVALPIAALGACVLFLAPGLLLALAAGGAGTVSGWVVAALPPAIGVSWLVVQLLRILSPASMGVTAVVMLGAVVVALGVALLVARRRPLPWPNGGARAWIPLGITAGAVMFLAAVLAPKFVAESLNGDGAHALEVSRVLLHQPWPFLPSAAGAIAFFPGMTSMLFTIPNAWFLQLFGVGEAAIRLPFLLHLGVLALAIQALAEVSGRRVGGRAHLVLWLGLGAYVLAMAFSASYSPYHADLALPATQDTLFMACFLGFALAMTRRAWGAAFIWAVLTHLSLPSGVLLLGFWLVAELLVVRPIAIGDLARGAGIVVACLATTAALGALVVATGSPAPGTEYGLARTIEELLQLDPTGWRRPIYWLVGAGIFPVLMLVRWQRQDAVARRLTIVTLCYFLFFAFHVRLSLHHLAPAMLLPAAVALRLRPDATAARHRYLLAWGALALVAVVLSRPGSATIGTATREVGRRLAVTVGTPGGEDPATWASSELLTELFPPEWEPEVPRQAYGGSALSWLVYATPEVVPGQTAYLLQPATSKAPSEGRIVAEDSLARLVVLDTARWTADRARRPPTNRHAPLYAISRETLFGISGPHVIDLRGPVRRVASRLGLHGMSR